MKKVVVWITITVKPHFLDNLEKIEIEMVCLDILSIPFMKVDDVYITTKCTYFSMWWYF